MIGPRFSEAGYFVDGLAPAAAKSKFGFIGKQGEFLVPPQFEHAYAFSEGLACIIAEGGKYGFIDSSGQFVISPRYDMAFAFVRGLAMVSRNGKWDRNAPLKYDGEWGYVDKTGSEMWDENSELRAPVKPR